MLVKWIVDPPPSVAMDAHFCKATPRRYKWPKEATIDSLEYNWPIIPGQFDRAEDCAKSYNEYFELHKTHTDPVCFRAAVFCNFMSMMCRNYGVQLNVNNREVWRPEFQLSLKLQYRSTRWNWMIEVMASTHFLYGAHGCFINEFRGTKRIPYDKWLTAQRRHNWKLMDDDDTCKAVERIEAEEYHRSIMKKDQHRNQGLQ